MRPATRILYSLRPDRTAVLAARSAARDTGNQPRTIGRMKGLSVNGWAHYATSNRPRRRHSADAGPLSHGADDPFLRNASVNRIGDTRLATRLAHTVTHGARKTRLHGTGMSPAAARPASPSNGIGGARDGRGRHLRWQPEMTQDPADDPRLVDDGDQAEPPSALRARQDVESETPLHQFRPEQVRWFPARGLRRDGWLRASLGLDAGLSWRRRVAVAETRSPRRPGAQHPVVQHQVDPRAWREHGQALQPFDRIEEQVAGPVRPSMAQIEEHLALLGQPDTVVRHGRP